MFPGERSHVRHNNNPTGASGEGKQAGSLMSYRGIEPTCFRARQSLLAAPTGFLKELSLITEAGHDGGILIDLD